MAETKKFKPRIVPSKAELPVTAARKSGTYPAKPITDPMPYKNDVMNSYKSRSFWDALNWASAKAREDS